jgi:hypothetical protein
MVQDGSQDDATRPGTSTQTVMTPLRENFHPSGRSYDDRTRERNAVVQQAALFAGTADLSALSETDIQQAVIGGI